MPVREVRQAIQSALDVIARTVKTARNIFQEDTSNRHSLIGRVLEYIQSDSHTSAATANDLPAELRLTTPTLLTTLPSSTHFLLLPPNLKSYKPYVDLNSTSSFVSQDFLVQKLDEWFRKSTDNLQNAIERWIADLQSVKEVWSVRSSVRKWIASASGLGDHETFYAKTFFDKACCQQVLAIWKLALARAEKAFREQLESTTSTLAEGQHTKLAGARTVSNQFTDSRKIIDFLEPWQIYHLSSIYSKPLLCQPFLRVSVLLPRILRFKNTNLLCDGSSWEGRLSWMIF
jgi:hypothetical protein